MAAPSVAPGAARLGLLALFALLLLAADVASV